MLKPLLENQRIQKVGQNLKRDVVALRGDGIELSGLYFDTMVADYLLDAGQRNHGLADLSKRYLNHDARPIEELIGSGSKQRGLDKVIPEELAPYAAEEADIALRLCDVLEPKLSEQGLDQMPKIRVFADA